jgi:hypothetical protein
LVIYLKQDEKILLTVPQLKQLIAGNLKDTVLIADRVHNWPASLKGWLEDLSDHGNTILLLSNYGVDEFFQVPILVLPPLSKQQIRGIICQELASSDRTLTPSQVRWLVGRSGGNPLLAKRLVKEFHQGFISVNPPQNLSKNLVDWEFTLFIWLFVGLMFIARLGGISPPILHLLLLGAWLAISLFAVMRFLSYFFRI